MAKKQEEKLRKLVTVDLKQLEEALDKAGAPATPGRLPDWKGDADEPTKKGKAASAPSSRVARSLLVSKRAEVDEGKPATAKDGLGARLILATKPLPDAVS